MVMIMMIQKIIIQITSINMISTNISKEHWMNSIDKVYFYLVFIISTGETAKDT